MGRMVRPHFAIHANNDPVEATELRHSYFVRVAPSNVSLMPRTAAFSRSQPIDPQLRRTSSRFCCKAWLWLFACPGFFNWAPDDLELFFIAKLRAIVSLILQDEIEVCLVIVPLIQACAYERLGVGTID